MDHGIPLKAAELLKFIEECVANENLSIEDRVKNSKIRNILLNVREIITRMSDRK